ARCHDTRLVACGVVFFFSSRRRHTRLVSDWSSDVCSSDLAVGGELELFQTASPRNRLEVFGKPRLLAVQGTLAPLREDRRSGGRSEERRVGKECRARGAREPWRRKTRRWWGRGAGGAKGGC